MTEEGSYKLSKPFWVVAGLHVLFILVLIAYSGVQRWLARRQPPDPVAFVSLHTPAPPEPAAVEASVPQPAPPPEPPPPEPAVVPEPPPRPRVERSQRRVRREAAPPPQPTLTPEQIRQRLQQAVPTTSRPTTGATSSNAYARYLSVLQETLYRAWTQPSSVLPGTTVQASIRVQRDGRIIRRTLEQPSGNRAMDDSVMRALQSVSRLQPLPEELTGAHHDFTIVFELSGAL